jgi:Alternative complex III, ActD subunit
VSHFTTAEGKKLYGLMAEFDSPEKLIRACDEATKAGYKRLGAYTPYPMEEVWEAIGHHRSKLPLIVLGGGLAGALGGFFFQYWASVQAYPMNIGGRPFNSWVAFIVPAFETTILFAAFAAVLGMFFLNGLPQPYHPAFNVPRFAQASRDRYFLMVTTKDKIFEPVAVRKLLEGLDPTEVNEVED